MSDAVSDLKPPEPLFVDLAADDGDQGISEIESLCMNCHEQGTTRLMLTRIPFFKEVILSSFQCDSCGYENREIQSGGRIQEQGIKYVVDIQQQKDLNRQVVKSDSATLAIPEVDFEEPPARRKGEISTVEGLIDGVLNNLSKEQPVRKIMDPDGAEKIDNFIERLKNLKTVEKPFQIILDDPSGNSFVENPLAPARDPAMTVSHYARTRAQDIHLGLVAEGMENSGTDAMVPRQGTEGNDQVTVPLSEKTGLKDEVLMFKTNCPECNTPCETNMKIVDIPWFKQVVIMATACEACGHRENEVKSGTGISPKGTKIKLKLTDPIDLSRDLLKSDTCGLSIPELDLNMEHGSLGGKFTTIEGLLTNIKDQLEGKNPFVTGDSAKDSTKSKLQEFCRKLDKVIKGELLNIHIILDDPAGNSYLQNVYAPDPDPELTVEHYDRNYEQNEMLGLNDMITENYTAHS